MDGWEILHQLMIYANICRVSRTCFNHPFGGTGFLPSTLISITCITSVDEDDHYFVDVVDDDIFPMVMIRRLITTNQLFF